MTYDGPWLWTAIVLIGLGTWGFRTSFIVLFGMLDEVPPWVDRVTRVVPPALFAAIIVPDVLVADGSVLLTLANDRLWAALVAGAVAWRTENMVATIATGMVVLWLLGFVG